MEGSAFLRFISLQFAGTNLGKTPVQYRAILAFCLATAVTVAQAINEPTAVPSQNAPAPVPDASQSTAHKFDLWELQVEGNTLLGRAVIERTVYPFLGPDKTVKDVEAARQALEVVYRDSGYPTVVVDIPEQNVKEGIVRLNVVQGTVSRVRVTGARYFSLGRIRSGVPALAEGSVPSVPALQEQLKQLNQASPDRTVTPIFRPGRTPGTVEAELRVKDDLPLHGDIELNNRNSRDTTNLRASASLRYANLWQREHSASLMFQTAPENTDEVRVLAGTYVWPLGDGKVLAAYLVHSKSNVATVGDLSVIGDGNILGARFIKTLPSNGSYYHSATFGVDYKDFKEDVLNQGSVGTRTPISYLNFLTQYNGTKVTEQSKLAGEFSVNFGLRGLANSDAEFENKRSDAKPNYMYFGAHGDYTRTYLNGTQLYGALTGQLAVSPLVSNEQLSAGGAQSVRGYYESQALGDDGVIGNLELRSPSYAKHVPHLRELRLLAFADAAKLRYRRPLQDQTARFELYSAGVGLQLQGEGGFDVSFDWAWPLADAIGVEKGDSRGNFRLHYGF